MDQTSVSTSRPARTPNEKIGYVMCALGILMQLAALLIGKYEIAKAGLPAWVSDLHQPGIPLMALGYVYARWTIIVARNRKLAIIMFTMLCLSLVGAIYKIANA